MARRRLPAYNEGAGERRGQLMSVASREDALYLKRLERLRAASGRLPAVAASTTDILFDHREVKGKKPIKAKGVNVSKPK